MNRHQLSDLRLTIHNLAGGGGGFAARAALLAYALLRGIPYRICEPITAPLPEGPAVFLRKRLAAAIAAAVPEGLRAEHTAKAAVEAWLLLPEPDDRRERRERRDREGRARNLARREDYRARVLAHRAGAA